jgi:hypothetical protein
VGTAILTIVGLVIMIALVFAGMKVGDARVVLLQGVRVQVVHHRYPHMKLQPPNSAGEVEAPILPVDTATMTPSELPATPVSPATDKDSQPTRKSNLRNAGSTLKEKAGRSRSRTRTMT